ncbi:MAG: CRTAC1 family protein [bacterium]|nr:CRTAC1 family protein [bacterium]
MRLSRTVRGVVLAAVATAAAGAETTSWFTDATESSGLRFVHETGAAGALAMPEIMGSGAALFDADGDGDLDAYFTNGRFAEPNAAVPRNRFFRRDGAKFVDATDGSGLGDPGYGMGVAIGDIDNDGDLDVFVSNYGPDRLFRNRGDATFADATASLGAELSGWSSSAVFLDYDGDGWLDLYVARYVVHDPGKKCSDSAGRSDYCGPRMFPPVHDMLLRNVGRGKFEPVGAASGLQSAIGAGLGVVARDFDGDARIDLYVANDGYANQLWHNLGTGKFKDVAPLMGTAYNMDGEAEAGMGVVAADFDGDLDLDLFVTHLADESNTIYRRDGATGFDDATGASGLATGSLPFTGFGTAALDLELDGDLDLVVVNGRVARAAPRKDAGVALPWSRFAEPNQIFVNRGSGRFHVAGAEARAFVEPVEVSRGLAIGDVDDDGDVDLLVSNAQGPARLYRNDVPRRGRWLRVRAIDPRYSRDAYGATVIVRTGERRRMRSIDPGGGYLSSGDPRAHFGLGDVERVDGIEVRWPDGLVERFPGGAVDRDVTLRRGDGKRAS